MDIEVFHSIAALDPVEWAQMTGPEFPFIDHRFLTALEVTGCLGERSGWTPLYLVARQDGHVSGALITFAKTNSYGEYIFDFAWANAYQEQGLSYYPKLVSAVPFTPATGPKLLFKPELSAAQRAEIARELLLAAIELGAKFKASSVHALFIPEGQIPYFKEAGYFIRHSYQFHWKNRGFRSFDGFLESLRGRRRKEILRERAQVQKAGLQIRRLTGNQLESEHAVSMYRFYLDTVHKRGGFDYLTRAFFIEIFKTMPEKILFATALNHQGQSVAGAVNYIGARALYGRQWGCVEDHKGLHFELCYYQGIEFSIEHQLALFEAGAQGEHKLSRGFLPSLTYSAHCLNEPSMDRAVRAFVNSEKRQLESVFREYESHNPYLSANADTPQSPLGR